MTGEPSLPFWKRKGLDQMTEAEWESLCDGCGKCCLHKFEDAETGEVVSTTVACRLLDLHTCRCSDYARRTQCVSDCLDLRTLDRRDFNWLPATCAYRLLEDGADLPEWHPLVCGDPERVHTRGVSVRDRVISELCIHPEDLERFAEPQE